MPLPTPRIPRLSGARYPGEKALLEGPVGLSEKAIRIQISNTQLCGPLGQPAIDRFINLAPPDMVCPRKKGNQKEFRWGQFQLDLQTDRLDAIERFFWNTIPGVVRANGNHHELRIDAIQLPVRGSSQDLLGPVAPQTQVQGVAVTVVFLPDRFADVFPSARDRASGEDQIHELFSVEPLHNLPMTRHLPWQGVFSRLHHRDDRVLLLTTERVKRGQSLCHQDRDLDSHRFQSV